VSGSQVHILFYLFHYSICIPIHTCLYSITLNVFMFISLSLQLPRQSYLTLPFPPSLTQPLYLSPSLTQPLSLSPSLTLSISLFLYLSPSYSEAESQKQHQVQNLRHALSSATALRIARQTEKETQAREEYR
jgi:hypothetical protein